MRIDGNEVSIKLLQAQTDTVNISASCEMQARHEGGARVIRRRRVSGWTLTCTSATTSCSSASARALISLLLITLLKSATHTHTHTREVHKISDRTVSSVSCAQTLTDEVDAVFGPSKLLDEMLHILLQKAETGYPGCHGSIGWWSDMGQYEYLGGSEKADGLQVFHVVSVLRVDSLKQVDFLLQDF